MRPVILVVDSQVSATSCWRQFLAQFACGVMEAVTIGDLDQLTTRRQSLVVTLNVETNHLALEAALQIHEQSPRAPVILVVQAGSEELAVAAFRAGVSDYFHFPGEELPLLAAVNRLRASRVGPWQP